MSGKPAQESVSAMEIIDISPEAPPSPEGWKYVFSAWCEANPAMVNCTVSQAVERVKALEDLWRAWRTVFSNRFGYDKTMPEAVKAMDRADKSLLARRREDCPIPPSPRGCSSGRSEEQAAS